MKMKEEDKFMELVTDALDMQISPEVELRMQSVIDQELNHEFSNEPRPIMVINELINYLRITPDILEDYLDEIPCFELGGKLLFRRDAVDKWIENKERQYRGEVASFNEREGLNFFIA